MEKEEDLSIDIDFNLASREWKSSILKTSIKQKKFYPWQSSRCGFIKETGEKCVKKSYFGKRDNADVVDVDECDGKIYCWFHKKHEQMDRINRKVNMEKHILSVLERQKELFISDSGSQYIINLKLKYSV